jgi:UDP-N-acetylmuramate dehydrogenase
MNDIAAVIGAARGELPQIDVRLDEPMRDHTSFRIGGRASAMFFPGSEDELKALLRLLSKNGVAPLIFGNGTNLLVEDGRLDLVAVKTHGVGGVRLTGECEITAACGITLARLAVFACEHGLAGLEFAHGIPGTLGGAVIMNAGAYGGEMRDVVVRTVSLLPDGTEAVTSGAEHGFSYRHSRFSGAGETVVSSVLELTEDDRREIRHRMDTLMRKRRDSQPLELPSAGSTFKRPAGGYAAALIEEAGLKGYAVGGAMVSEKHSGFVVNRGGATFSDVQAVMEHVRETVFKKTGIELEPEVKIIRANGD